MKLSFKQIFICGILLATISSCSKSSPAPAAPAGCASVTITVTATPTSATPCANNGSISVTAAGSTGFTYKLTGGAYQSAAVFNSLAAGNYTVFARDANGCESSKALQVGAGGAAGPLFTAVKALIANRCVSCHNATNLSGGQNWTVDCNVVSHAALINQRVVVQGNMPTGGPLPQSEKNIITAWINGGGGYTN